MTLADWFTETVTDLIFGVILFALAALATWFILKLIFCK